MDNKLLEWAVELQSIAQGALYYCRDEFDIERFKRIRDISAEMVSLQSELPPMTMVFTYGDIR